MAGEFSLIPINTDYNLKKKKKKKDSNCLSEELLWHYFI